MADPRSKRILRDVTKCLKEQPEGIYIHVNEEKIDSLQVMIIGPKETPYEGGYYFFVVKFPDDYPYSPPKVTYKTSDGTIRFNPNYYADGKVCLSLIGTFGENSWNPAVSLTTLLVTLQSRLNENPLINEPGHEKGDTNQHEDYKKYVLYYNFMYAIYHNLKKDPYAEIKECSLKFKEVMIENFLDNYSSYIEKLESHGKSSGEISTIWSFKGKLDFGTPLSKMKELKELLEK